MKKAMGWITVILLLILVSGCGPSTQSGVNKEYDMKMTVSGQSVVNLNIALDADTAAETASGDAPATLDFDSRLTAAWDAAQAQGVEEGVAFLKDVQNWLDKRFQQDNSQGGGTTPAPQPQPEPKPEPKPEPGPIPEPEPEPVDSEYTVVEEAACDQEMSFRDGSGENSVIQKKCIFSKAGPEYGQSFVVQWSSGKTLDVVDSSRMNWLMKDEDGNKDYRKYHPHEPDHQGGYVPGTPAEVYAGRGDQSEKAAIMRRYQTEFHHTTTASSDGGKSLVMCPKEDMVFDSCSSNGVTIPYHGKDDGRIIYWNMNEEPVGDIVCEKDGKKYYYPADEAITYGECEGKT